MNRKSVHSLAIRPYDRHGPVSELSRRFSWTRQRSIAIPMCHGSHAAHKIAKIIRKVYVISFLKTFP